MFSLIFCRLLSIKQHDFYAIFQWASIDELNKLRNLSQLKFKRNPLLGQDAYTDRYLILAKVKGLKLLDRSTVSTVLGLSTYLYLYAVLPITLSSLSLLGKDM
jgi:hypothetical protein